MDVLTRWWESFTKHMYINSSFTKYMYINSSQYYTFVYQLYPNKAEKKNPTLIFFIQRKDFITS